MEQMRKDLDNHDGRAQLGRSDALRHPSAWPGARFVSRKCRTVASSK